MNISKIMICFAILAALLVVPVHAFDFEMSATNISVSQGDIQAVELNITTAVDDTIIFALDGIQPWVTIPVTIELLKNVPLTTRIYFAPSEQDQLGTYKMTLMLHSQKTGSVSKRDFYVNVKGTNVMIEKIDIKGNMTPGSTDTIQILLKNYENKIENVILAFDIVKEDGTEFKHIEESVKLHGQEFLLFEKSIFIPQCTMTGQYKINAVLVDKNSMTVSKRDYDFEIKRLFSTITIREEIRDGLRTDYIITTKNIGNVEGIATVKENIWGLIFFSSDTPAALEGGGVKWQFELGGCNAKIIKYSIDYTAVVSGLIILILLLYIFLRLRTIRIKKFVMKKQMIEQGEEYTVGIDLKSFVGTKNVEIRDFVPSIFDVVDTPGIKPIKNKSNAGTELIWKFREFKSGEERLVDYKIVPTITVTGTVSLPKAHVIFHYLGKTFKKVTDVPHIGLEHHEEKEDDENFMDKVRKKFKKDSE